MKNIKSLGFALFALLCLSGCGQSSDVADTGVTLEMNGEDLLAKGFVCTPIDEKKLKEQCVKEVDSKKITVVLNMDGNIEYIEKE